MKLIFSLLFAMSLTPVWARDIILVENLASNEEGRMLIKIIGEKFSIPNSIVTYQSKTECSTNTEAIMHLCLQKNGELEIVKINRFVVKNSLSAFFEGEVQYDKENRK